MKIILAILSFLTCGHIVAQTTVNQPVFNGPAQIGNNNIMTFNDGIVYANTSRLDAYGREIVYSWGMISPESDLTKLMKRCFVEIGNRAFVRVDDSSLFCANEVIAKYPRFPFGYYCRAIILQNIGDKRWIDDAKKSIEILAVTTKIDGHKSDHDQVLAFLNDLLTKASKN